MMSDSPFDIEIVKTRELFFCQVGTNLVDPREVIVGLQDGETEECLAFKLQMAEAVLRHELQEAGAEIGTRTLRDFVQKDIDSSPIIALKAYLRITQVILQPAQKKHFFGLIRTKPEQTRVKWKVTGINGVEESQHNTLIITGVVSPLGAEKKLP